MKLVYVSGPYRSKLGRHFVSANIRRAQALATKLWTMGFSVICPHTNAEDIDGLIPDDQILAGEMVIVQRCDALVMTEDWEPSVGAHMERECAFEHNIPVFYWPSDTGPLTMWRDGGFDVTEIVQRQVKLLENIRKSREPVTATVAV